MKNGASLITYISALVVGVLLLIFSHESALSKGIMTVIGILFIIPSALMLINSLSMKKIVDGQPKGRPWLLIICAALWLILGIWMVVNPLFFAGITVYTIGAVLILCGIASIIFIAMASRPFGAFIGWYIVPVLTFGAGVVICCLGPNATATFAAIFAGCFLIAYGCTGVSSLGREPNRKNKNNKNLLKE